MAHRDDITEFCSNLLKITEVTEIWCENGMQVEGAEKVTKIALGVTASQNFLSQAAQWGAQMAIVHHGLFLKKGVSKITGILKNRLQVLLTKNMSLLGFHIPLDTHPEIGNNAALLEMLDLKYQEEVDCGCIAKFTKSKSFSDVQNLVEEKIGHINFAENWNKDRVQRVAVISGGAASYAESVAKKSVDLFLFGEMKESDYHVLKELQLPFIAAGHFATERYGVQKLGDRIRQNFSDVEVEFFDEECPI